MSFQQKDGYGALFKNEEKENPKHADYQGSIMVGNKEYWLNGWVKKTGKGDTFLSLSARPKERRGSGGPKSTSTEDLDFDDSLPF